MARVRAIEIIEAAYDLASDRERWLTGMVEAARLALDQGMGIAGYTFAVGARGRYRLTSGVVGSGELPSGALAGIERTVLAFTRQEVAWSLEVPLETASEGHRRHGTQLGDCRAFRHARAVGIVDWLSLKGVGPSGAGFTIVAALAEPRATTRIQKLRWSRVALHVAAAMRLRDRVGADEDDAAVSARGGIGYAREGARSGLDVLRTAAVRTDRAVSRGGRRDPDAASTAWRALVQGRCSLFDRFDLDGRRYLVASRNQAGALGPRLSGRELQVLAQAARGDSNKQIAYELGLATSTVSSHLRGGMRALGVRDRAELAALLTPSVLRSVRAAIEA